MEYDSYSTGEGILKAVEPSFYCGVQLIQPYLYATTGLTFGKKYNSGGILCQTL